MAKGAVGLVSGYWPDDVYRHLAVPGLSLDDCLIVRPSRRRPDQTALRDRDRTFDYRQLSAEVDRCAALLQKAVASTERRVALISDDSLEIAIWFLAGTKARCALFLANPDLPTWVLLEQMMAFQANLVLAGMGVSSERFSWAEAEQPSSVPSVPPGEGRGDGSALEPAPAPTPADIRAWRVITIRELSAADAGQPVPARPGAPARPAAAARVDLKGPAVALSGADDKLIYHSHASLVAWAISWSAFVPVTEGQVFCSLEPPYRWGGLLALLGALSRGASCSLFQTESSDEALDYFREQTPDYAVLSFGRARALAASAGKSFKRTLGGRVGGAFVTVEAPFAVSERRHIESTLDVPVLTLFGNAACGPAVAAHPSWYLDEAIGIPVTNVDLWPLHPSTGQPLTVPWEAIDYAELGIKSPMLAVSHQTEDDRAEWIKDGWLRTRLIALMDPSGLFYLRPWR